MGGETMRRSHEVAIVGCGPAGAILALALARSGRDVLILEKEALPRYKPCGGGVTAKALRLLDFSVDEVVERTVDAAQISFERRRNIPVTGRGLGVMVMRSTFDHFLASKAVAAGATLRDRCPVSAVRSEAGRMIVVTPAGEFASRIVVGADGANSAVARSTATGRGARYGVAIEAEIESPPDVVDAQRVVFDFGAVPGGYAYIFPKKRHLSVGVYTMRARAPDLRARLESFLRDRSGLARFRILSLRGHRVPLGRAARHLHGAGVVLLGDAAGLGDPLWGEGISYAIKSARIAAVTISEGLASVGGPPALHGHTQTVRREILADLRHARRFALLFHRLPERLRAALVEEPARAGRMMDVLRGNTSYRDYVRAMIFGFPR